MPSKISKENIYISIRSKIIKKAFVYMFSYNYNGREYTVTSKEGSDPPRYQIGDRTVLKIDPSDPEYYYDPSSNVTLVLGAVFGFLGLVFCGTKRTGLQI